MQGLLEYFSHHPHHPYPSSYTLQPLHQLCTYTYIFPFWQCEQNFVFSSVLFLPLASPPPPPPPPQDGSRWYWPLHLPVASFIRGILAAVGGYNDLRTRSLGSEDSGESGSSTKLKSQSSASSAGPLMALLAFEALLLMLYVADESRDYNATSVWCNSHSH